MFHDTIKTYNQQIVLPFLEEKNIELWVKREDLIHEFVSGNKFRKLKYNILEAQEQGKKTLLTFGGAYSNHIVATAVAGKLSGFNTIGVIRGGELGNNLEKTLANNKTLNHSYKNGMNFEFVSRENYSKKHELEFIDSLKEKYGDFYLIPEGGTNELAIKGCEEILLTEDEKFDYICVAVGTGGTISGILKATEKHQKVLGFSALKGDFLKNDIEQLAPFYENWELITGYHFGGYAKYNSELISFLNQFKNETDVLLDPIYTGKMMFGVLELIKKNKIKEGSKVLAIHTGGVQGIDGINKKLQKRGLDLIKI